MCLKYLQSFYQYFISIVLLHMHIFLKMQRLNRWRDCKDAEKYKEKYAEKYAEKE